MRIIDLLEGFGRGNQVSPSEHELLYHLTDYAGFTHTIFSNALKSKGYGQISTTWDPTMNRVYAKDFSVFKFVLDAPTLIAKYGAHHFDDYATIVGTRQKQSHNEREIRIETAVVEPFSDFHLGTVIAFDLFTESGIQWLLYRGSEGKAIETLYKHVFELRKPLWKGNVGTSLSKADIDILREAYRNRHLPYEDALIKIADRFSILDHFDQITDGATYSRRRMIRPMMKELNSKLTSVPIKDIDIAELKNMIARFISQMNFKGNLDTVMKSIVLGSDIVSPVFKPVHWGSLLKTIADGNPEIVRKTVDFFKEEYNWLIRRFENKPNDIFFIGFHTMGGGW